MNIRCIFSTPTSEEVPNGVRYCKLTHNSTQCGTDCQGLREDKLSCPFWRRH